MNLLLDTHALLGAVANPDALSVQARNLLTDGQNMLLVSSASVWEIATKHRRLGCLPEAQVLLASSETHLRQLRAEELPISVRHALTAGSLPSVHRDPFDRILAAQALLEGLALVSRDEAFAHFPIRTVW